MLVKEDHRTFDVHGNTALLRVNSLVSVVSFVKNVYYDEITVVRLSDGVVFKKYPKTWTWYFKHVDDECTQ